MEGYSVQRVIGCGSFGRALVVLCKHTGDQYVLKQIQLPTNQSKRGNSRREAALLSRMKHPNIVAFREEFEADGQLCIVMEYCSAGDLLQRIRQQEDALFSVDHILRWFAQMCAGTKHVHDKKVLHRDLKSKNIFLTANGTIKLGDFGSACVLNSSRAYANTYVGTPYYVSPEIWDNKPYNNKSDVWSLGCVLYELCTLRHPFQASSWKSLILKVCRGAYPPLPSHLPYELHYLLKQMFKTNPKDRPSLSTILTSHRVTRLLRAHLPSQATEEASWPPARGRRRRSGGGWSREEGERVVAFLAQKSLITTTSSSGDIEAHCESEEPGIARKQWSAVPSDTALRALGDASLLSDSVPPTRQTHAGEQQEARQRRQWDKDPPARLLSLLEKVQLSSAFRTYSIHREEGDNPLVGPLSLPQVDQTDGPEEEVSLDDDRLEPRSDDEDTDFEDECPCDWMEELHNMSLEH